MCEVWLKVVQMSLSASWMVLAVAIVRRVVDRAHEGIWVLLWGLVGVRLVCPISLESVWSIVPRTEPVLEPLILSAASNATGGGPIGGQVGGAESSASTPLPSWDWTACLAVIWLVGVVAMCVYACMIQMRLRRKVNRRSGKGKPLCL